ncbi:SOS response-associated peptidase [Achromobacter deleyi]|uniref:SOS response-associated peptidase n=1 Tax=Achromobacter deleyi TaxID=1353891 RepID=UPI001465C2F2|nr:SOS response-associated peptidase family protein [Achromobacter deleyi]CAB3882432.1 hypothetical protein LMG3412_03328 [Achromobacter deleyi]
MCSHYQTLKDAELLLKLFGVPMPEKPYAHDMHPGVNGLFVRRPIKGNGNGNREQREAVVGRWGLTRRGAAPSPKLSTFNARSDRLETARTFQAAWFGGQRCIIPADAIFEPDWRQKFQISTRFTRADGHPLGLAGIWERGLDAEGGVLETYSMITVNADDHALFQRYHRSSEEKRMVVLLADTAYDAWLGGSPDEAMSLLRGAPAESWCATPMPQGNATNLSLF